MKVFDLTYNDLARQLIQAPQVDVGEWHAQSTQDNPMLVTRELLNVQVHYKVPHFMVTLEEEVRPNQPFA